MGNRQKRTRKYKYQTCFCWKKNWYSFFESYISEYELDPESIVITGYLDEEDIAKIFSAALFSIYPSFYEGFGLPVLESMACGRFCLASNSTSIPEVVGPDLPMLDPADASSIAKQMMKLIKENDYRESLHQIAFRNSKKFTIDQLGIKSTDAIESALRHKLGNTSVIF